MSEPRADGMPQIGLIAKMQLQRGDILVISSPNRLSWTAHDRLRDMVGSMLDKLGLTCRDVPTLVLEEGLSLSVLSTGALTEQQRVNVMQAIEQQVGDQKGTVQP